MDVVEIIDSLYDDAAEKTEKRDMRESRAHEFLATDSLSLPEFGVGEREEGC